MWLVHHCLCHMQYLLTAPVQRWTLEPKVILLKQITPQLPVLAQGFNS